MKKETVIKFVRNENNKEIEEAKRIIIERIVYLLRHYFSGKLEFKKAKNIRLDKYDMDMDITLPMDFAPISIVYGKRRVFLTYMENEHDPLCKGDYIWTDDLRDLTLSDCQCVLYALEQEIV